MTAEKFRRLALSFPGAIESAHMDHPDFRVGGSIFATLGYPDEKWGMVKFTPEQQQTFLKKAPGVFAPCSGAWGRRGSTKVYLASARVDLIREVLGLAWQNADAKKKKA